MSAVAEARKRYSVILADPPWRYGGTDQFQPEGEDKFRALRMRYPTMRTEDICALDVAALAADDCVLLLWATAPLLKDALAVVRAWGFEYKTKMPWIKLEGDPARSLFPGHEWVYRPQYGTGFWGRGCAEDVLICKRGNPKPPPAAASSVLLLSENFGHSRKPENLYEYAEYFPGPYLEMFARRARPGWDLFGDEVASTVEVAAVAGGA